MACIHASQNDRGIHGRAKHIDTRVHRLRQLVDDGEVELVKIDTTEQVADNFTKPLTSTGVKMSRDVTSGARYLMERGLLL